RAQAQKRIHETMAGPSDRSAFEAFDRMPERSEEAQDRPPAAAEASERLTGHTLEREFARLEVADVDQRLFALKQRLGLAAPSAPPAAALPSGDSGNSVATGANQLKPAHVDEEDGLIKDAELEDRA